MRKITIHFSRLAVWAFLLALLAACGNKSATTAVISTPNPTIFSVQSVALNSNNLLDWGGNTYGQLGNGTTGTNQLFPALVLTLPNVAGASAGGTHTLAFTGAGTAWAWGNNFFGQLGNGNQIISFIPVPVSFQTVVTVIDVAAGANHSLARDNTGQLWAWGDNSSGQLGNNTVNISLIPVSVLVAGAPLTQVTKIAAGGGHSLAIALGTAYAWGLNGFGQLGQPANTANQLSAVSVKDISAVNLQNVTDIAAGGGHSLFVSGGNVWACGLNGQGQLGVGDTIDRNSGVVQVTGLTGISQVAAGLDHSLALKTDGGTVGTVWAWGYNFSGQLGTGAAPGSIFGQATPAQVRRFDGVALTGITKIVAIGNHSLAVDGTGQLWAWGDNTFGQLGNGSLNSSNLAVRVSLATGSDLYHP